MPRVEKLRASRRCLCALSPRIRLRALDESRCGAEECTYGGGCRRAEGADAALARPRIAPVHDRVEIPGWGVSLFISKLPVTIWSAERGSGLHAAGRASYLGSLRWIPADQIRRSLLKGACRPPDREMQVHGGPSGEHRGGSVQNGPRPDKRAILDCFQKSSPVQN